MKILSCNRRGMKIDIAALRKRLDMTPQELAEAVGCDPVTVWRWEAGERAPRGLYLKALEAIAAKAKRK